MIFIILERGWQNEHLNIIPYMFDVIWRAYENELLSSHIVLRFQIFIDKKCNLITNVNCAEFRVDYAGGQAASENKHLQTQWK